jgi:hypothetical protein
MGVLARQMLCLTQLERHRTIIGKGAFHPRDDAPFSVQA